MEILSSDIITQITAAVMSRGGKPEKGEIRFLCPIHEDHNPSARWNPDKKVWHCDVCKAGGGWRDLAEKLGVDIPNGKGKGKSNIVATYDYIDENSKLLFQVVRLEPKSFRQRRPDGAGGWIWNTKAVRLVPYRLPQVLQAVAQGEIIFVVEGEKDCDNLARLGLTATTNPRGAGKWPADFAQYFAGANVVIPPDNDQPGRDHAQQVAQALAPVAAEVKVLELPDLPAKGDVSDWLAAGGTKEELLALAQEAPRWEPGPADQQVKSVYDPWLEALGKTRYRADRHGNLCYVKYTEKGGEEEITIANFLARPVREIVRDNGADREIEFEIIGILAGGRELHTARVAAKDFASLSWVPQAWGLGANVEPGQGCKDKVRHAIQCLAQDVQRETIYTHLGWRKIDGQWLYLYAGGAIGENGPVDGVAVDPGQKLKDYVLPDPPQGEALRQAVRASLSLLDMAPEVLTCPLLAAVCRVPLAEALPVDLSLFLAGQTGVKKTELTALAQAHWGAGFHGKNLPGNWDSTANALEKLAFLVKDAVLVVDDFAPKGATSDVQKLHREADRLLRAQGNLAGRDRMQADGKLRVRYEPRGLIISSGEDIPRGQSLRARGLILEVGPEDVNLEQLTKAQHAARNGLLAASMAGYVKWLAPRMDELKAALRARHEALRAEARKANFSHDRTPDIVANLALGWEYFLAFATEAGAVSKEEADELWGKCWKALLAAGEAQAGHLASEEPTGRFLALLAAAITSGKAHITDAKTGREPEDAANWGWWEQTRGAGENAETDWRPLGDLIGWLDGEDLLLDPEAAYAAAQKLARDQNASLAITQRVLWKRLAERGVIFTEKDAKQTYYTLKRTVAGQRRRVLVMQKSLAPLISHNMGNMGNMGKPLQDNGFRTQNAPMFFETPEKHGQKTWAVDSNGDNSMEKCPYNVPMFLEQKEKHGQENGPGILAAQGPVHNAHEAHEMRDKIAQTFNDDAAATTTEEVF